jgi:hypothetical protein
MPTIKPALMLLIAVGIPAATHSLIGSAPHKCFASSGVVYHLGGDGPGIAVRVAHDLPQPDLTVTLSDRPETADFILIDDDQNDGTAYACGGSIPEQTIRVNDAQRPADLTVAVGDPKADLKIYVRSTAFSIEEAAALFAVMVSRKPVAIRSN